MRRRVGSTISKSTWRLAALLAATALGNPNPVGAQTSARRLRFESAPAPNSVIKDIVKVGISADPSFQPNGVTYELAVDGKTISAILPPAVVDWDTRRLVDGPHLLQLIRRIPSAGKTVRETFREEIPVLVANGASSPRSEAAPNPFDAIDRHALAATADSEASLTRLAAYLTAPAKSDLEKTRAIYRWVAGRIRWGPATGVNPGEPMDSRTESVLSRRTAECLGFARLFVALAKTAGLEAESIQGYVRTDASTVGEFAANPAAFNHWWNAVKLEGKWRLLDCGWSVRGQDGTTAASATGPVHLDGYYFLPSPDQLIFTHFPLDSRWQLVDSPLDLESQKRLPYPRPDFFGFGLSLRKPLEGVIRARTGFSVLVGSPDDVVMAATLSRGGRQIARINAHERTDGGYEFKFANVSPGHYRLSLFAKRRADPGVYTGVLDYEVEAE